MRLHKSGEDYLEAILILEKKKGSVRSLDVAEQMNVKKNERQQCDQAAQRGRISDNGWR